MVAIVSKHVVISTSVFFRQVIYDPLHLFLPKMCLSHKNLPLEDEIITLRFRADDSCFGLFDVNNAVGEFDSVDLYSSMVGRTAEKTKTRIQCGEMINIEVDLVALFGHAYKIEKGIFEMQMIK